MTINIAMRFFSLGLAAALFASPCNAQDAPGSRNDASASSDIAPAPSTSAPTAGMAPPKAPKVTCVGDQLTILADNSTLGFVLKAVHACTGVQFDVPEAAAGSRVFEELGPGPARQVLESLLNGTDLNYVIESASDDPQKIGSIMLMARSTDAPGSAVAGTGRSLTPARRAWRESIQNRRPDTQTNEEASQNQDSSSDSNAADEASPEPPENTKANASQPLSGDTPAPSPEAPASPDNGAAPPAPSASPAPAASPVSNQGTSTADRIGNMEQMFQQRRQMNQNQSPTSPQN